jgi:hypothetical protein
MSILARIWIGVVLGSALAPAQSPDQVQALLDRLAQLEHDNESLRREIGELRSDLTSLAESNAISERRIDEQEQKKVEAAQLFPVRLRGVLLVNAFRNSAGAGGADTPLVASRTPGPRTSAVTMRQTVIGLEFRGPQSLWGARISGKIFGDFYQGLSETEQYPAARLRTAELRMDWGARSLVFAQDKPLFSRRDPTTFSYVGVSPLTGSGNLWRWMPQVRFEQRFGSSEGLEVNLQGAVVQTSEEFGGFAPASRIERRRPGLEGRAVFSYAWSDERRVEIAPGFHVSQSHVGGFSVPSRLVSVDWFAKPAPYFEFSGVFWSGENVQHFGALRQGWVVGADNVPRGVRSKGGWAQATVPFNDRLSLNVYGGVHDDRDRDILFTGIAANKTGAANLMYRLAPNVMLSLEALQSRARYLRDGERRLNRYDLSLAYLF